MSGRSRLQRRFLLWAVIAGALLAVAGFATSAAASGTSTVFSENFNSGYLPASWTSSATFFGSDWYVDSGQAKTQWAYNYAENYTERTLTSPTIRIASAGAKLSFTHSYNFEQFESCVLIWCSYTNYGGAVLELSIGGGTFAAVDASLIEQGTYTGTLNAGSINGSAWVGTSSAPVTTIVDFPATAAGQQVQFRWRMYASHYWNPPQLS
jgi:hypothetical protein